MDTHTDTPTELDPTEGLTDSEELLTVEGDYRAVIGYDPYPEPPDWDGQGTIVQLDSTMWSETTAHVMHHPDLNRRNDKDRHWQSVNDFGLAALYSRFNRGHYRGAPDAMAMVERYLRIFRGVVGFDYFDTRGDKYVVIVTEADLTEWGFESLADFRAKVPKVENPASGIPAAWKAWTEGEVYYYRIDRRTEHKATEIDWTGSRIIDYGDTWAEVETVHGYYGHDDVKQAATEVLAGYTETAPERP